MAAQAKCKAVIFDLDGLMLDTEPLYRIAWKRASAECGFELTDEIYKSLVGRGRKDAERTLAETFGSEFPPEKFRALAARYEEQEFAGPPMPKKPGLDELLAFLELKHVPLAVATSTERRLTRPRLARAGLLSRFDAIATGDEVSRGKPFPDLFLLAAKRLGAEPSSCLVLEDSEAGVFAARAAGMQVFQVPDLVEPSAEVRRAATSVFRSLFDVLETLKTSCLSPAARKCLPSMIKTERLIALPLSRLDREEVRVMDRDPQIMATLGGVRSEEESERWLRDNLEHWERHGFGIWVFRDAASGEVVGRAGLRRVEVEGAAEVELGYVVASKFWGQGLATEMARAILERGYPSVAMDRVIALIEASNLRSLRVAGKLGFRFERNAMWKGFSTTMHRRNAGRVASGSGGQR
jgi:HAD superfamily hydrolase (TIGR01509 family)